jgi:hypothetical protein
MFSTFSHVSEGQAMRISSFLAIGAMCMALVGCGGGGSDSSTADNTDNSLVASACTIAITDPLLAVSLNGVVGSAQFSGGGSQLSYSNGLTGSLGLVKDGSSAACIDSTTSNSNTNTSMATAMQTGASGLGVSHVTVSGVNQPALLLNTNGLASNSSVSALQGNYVVLRYQQDTSGGGQTRMSYATFSIDGSGNWNMCKNTANCSTPTATGSFAATAGSSNAFDLSSSGLVRAKAYLMGTGANRVLVVAENDSGGGGVVTGLWLGAPQSSWSPVAGSYVMNSSDGAQSSMSVSLQNVVVGSQNHALTADSPFTGVATTTASNGNTNYLLSSPAGLVVTGNNEANNFGNGPGYFSFGVKP